MRRLALPCLLGWIATAACSGSSVTPVNEQSMQTLNHPMGFAVRFDSQNLSETQTERGFQFLARDAATRRASSTIDIILEAGTQPSEKGRNPEISRDAPSGIASIPGPAVLVAICSC
jgi:hypothetical protein